jgi:bacillithiol synthase
VNIQQQYINHINTNSFSKIVLDYLNNNNALKPFFEWETKDENWAAIIATKKVQNIDRNTLVNVLQQQYAAIETLPIVTANINALQHENTFTICTAHQPIIFTGPLYFIYKIMHAIKLAAHVQRLHPDFKIVPIFYMGSEDADIEEVGQVFFRDKTYHWQPDQSGAVGRMPLEKLQPILSEILNRLNINDADTKAIYDIIKMAYSQFETLGAATRYLVNALFGKYGLIVLDPDDAQLKKIFAPVIQHELMHGSSFNCVTTTNEQLIKANYKPQATARNINVFYLNNNIRERIEKNNEYWQVVNTDIQFSESELIVELNAYPERFSGNVILRGLFQESILPNLAFIGGGGELAYWLQLKKIFTLHNVPYPMLVLRQSFQLISSKTMALLQKLQLEIADGFEPELTLVNNYLLANHTALDFSEEDKLFEKMYALYKAKAAIISKPLLTSIEAHKAKNEHIKTRIKQKIKSHIRQAEQDKMIQFKKLHQAFFPDNTFQERKLNAIDYLSNTEWLDNLLKAVLPYGNQFGIIDTN